MDILSRNSIKMKYSTRKNTQNTKSDLWIFIMSRKRDLFFLEVIVSSYLQYILMSNPATIKTNCMQKVRQCKTQNSSHSIFLWSLKNYPKYTSKIYTIVFINRSIWIIDFFSLRKTNKNKLKNMIRIYLLKRMRDLSRKWRKNIGLD